MALSLSAKEIAITPAQFLDLLISQGKYEEARAVLAQLPSSPLDKALVEAKIAMKEGRISDAIEGYRKVLEIRPDLISIRVTLSKLLIENREYDRASYHMNILRDGAKTDEERAVITKRINEISTYQPYGASFEFSLTPSENINGAGADTTTYKLGEVEFVIENPEELQPQFGWRGSLGVSAYYRSRIADKHQMILRLNASTHMHTYDTIDYQFANLSTVYQYQDAKTVFELGPFVQRYWGDGEYYVSNQSQNRADLEHRDEDYTGYGYTISASRVINPKNKVSAYFRHTNRYFDSEELEYRDSYSNYISLNHQYTLGARDRITWRLGYERFVEASAQRDYVSQNSYIAKSIGLSWTHVYQNGVFTEFGADYKNRYYDQVYGGIGYKREDDVYGLSVNVQNNNWQVGNFVPRLNCRFENTASNIGSFQVSGTNCGISLSTDF